MNHPHSDDETPAPEFAQEQRESQHSGEKIVRIDMLLLGARNYPTARVTLPEAVVDDLSNLVASARELNPAVHTEAVVRAIWRLGSYRLQQNLLRRIPVRVSELPAPAH